VSAPLPFRRARAAAGLAALLAAGCLGRSPEVQLYTMAPLAGDPVAGAPGPELAIAVGPASFPRYLERPQIVTRVDPQRVEVDEHDRWAGGFEANVLRALGGDLAQQLGSERLVVYPSDAPFPLDYRISLDVHEFAGRPAGELLLDVRWVVRSPASAEVLAVGDSRIQLPVGGGIESLVRAHGEALAELARQIALRVAELERSRAEAGDAR
jgi:uncharacterized lipoprotein YmbA